MARDRRNRRGPTARLYTPGSTAGRRAITNPHHPKAARLIQKLARIAKLAGAPGASCAGIALLTRIGDFVERGDPLFTLHAASPGELAYALEYANAQADTVQILGEA